MTYKVIYGRKWERNILYFDELGKAVRFLDNVKKNGGSGAVYKCGKKEEVVAS